MAVGAGMATGIGQIALSIVARTEIGETASGVIVITIVITIKSVASL
jgi:hypothetical protein